jgi:hypothetical protein
MNHYGCFLGLLKVHAHELINVVTETVYKHVSTMMLERHATLFALLVALERLRLDHKLTNQELGLFTNGIDTLEIEDNIVFEDKPNWVSNKVYHSMYFDYCCAMHCPPAPYW